MKRTLHHWKLPHKIVFAVPSRSLISRCAIIITLRLSICIMQRDKNSWLWHNEVNLQEILSVNWSFEALLSKALSLKAWRIITKSRNVLFQFYSKSLNFCNKSKTDLNCRQIENYASKIPKWINSISSKMQINSKFIQASQNESIQFRQKVQKTQFLCILCWNCYTVTEKENITPK